MDSGAVFFASAFLAIPAAIYFVLAFLPPGRTARTGFMAAGALLALVWLGRAFSFGPLFTGDAHADGFATAAASIWTGAVLLAGLVQALRATLLRGRGGVLYGALVLALFFAGAMPALFFLGA